MHVQVDRADRKYLLMMVCSEAVRVGGQRWLAGCMGFLRMCADSFFHAVASPFHSCRNYRKLKAAACRWQLAGMGCRCKIEKPIPRPGARVKRGAQPLQLPEHRIDVETSLCEIPNDAL